MLNKSQTEILSDHYNVTFSNCLFYVKVFSSTVIALLLLERSGSFLKNRSLVLIHQLVPD